MEASHLLHEGDTAKDGRPSKAEILGNWTMFVGSQASNHAEDLTQHHAEPEPRERAAASSPRGLTWGAAAAGAPPVRPCRRWAPDLGVPCPCALHAGENQWVNFTP